ncbi:hypothetical protein PGTUg99_004744 [Puccinia graminis f. sp. tritici]|uniref:Uncharacterized protein n=1 Tax=Puccinia graminis f. sp. tritici TaxID=56615 RepID=A0A5B0RBF0_PUCGR|nr:hypothetical protein PGTUg99_004744 [Puccinia graminis f. sp. tritici]
MDFNELFVLKNRRPRRSKSSIAILPAIGITSPDHDLFQPFDPVTIPSTAPPQPPITEGNNPSLAKHHRLPVLNKSKRSWNVP